MPKRIVGLAPSALLALAGIRRLVAEHGRVVRRAPRSSRSIPSRSAVRPRSRGLRRGTVRGWRRSRRRACTARSCDRGSAARASTSFVSSPPSASRSSISTTRPVTCASGASVCRQRNAGLRHDALDAARRESLRDRTRLRTARIAERPQQRRTTPLRALRRAGVSDEMQLHAEVARRKGLERSRTRGWGGPRETRASGPPKSALRPSVPQGLDPEYVSRHGNFAMSWKPEVDEIERRRAPRPQQGGAEAVAKQHARGRLDGARAHRRAGRRGLLPRARRRRRRRRAGRGRVARSGLHAVQRR